MNLFEFTSPKAGDDAVVDLNDLPDLPDIDDAPIDWGTVATQADPQPMEQSRLAKIFHAANPCGIEICCCETDIRPARSRTEKFLRGAVAGLFMTMQMSAGYLDAQVTQDDYETMRHPAYPAFVSLVRDYQWHTSLKTLGLDSPGRTWHMLGLEKSIMEHPARPASLSLGDIGGIGCLPGSGGWPGDGTKACHAIISQRKNNRIVPALGLDNV